MEGREPRQRWRLQNARYDPRKSSRRLGANSAPRESGLADEERGIYSQDGTLLFRCSGTESQADLLDRAAEALAVRREVVTIVGDNTLISVEKAALISFSTCDRSSRLRRRLFSTCDRCSLPLGPSSFVLKAGCFGTRGWRQQKKDAIGEIAEELSREFLGWTGDNIFCNVCWSTRAFLFRFDVWRQEPELYLKLLRRHWGRDVPEPGRWIELVDSMFSRVDELEDKENPSRAVIKARFAAEIGSLPTIGRRLRQAWSLIDEKPQLSAELLEGPCEAPPYSSPPLPTCAIGLGHCLFRGGEPLALGCRTMQ